LSIILYVNQLSNTTFSIEINIGSKVLVGKTEGKRLLGRPRGRWEDNIKNGSSGSGKGLWGLDGVGSG
jgi:hypothetical protein